MVSIRRRMVPMILQQKTETQDEYGAKVESWVNQETVFAAPHVVSGSRLAQIQLEYEDTTHVLLTSHRGSQASQTRFLDGDTIYEPTFVNEGGRLTQVFCKVVRGNG